MDFLYQKRAVIWRLFVSGIAADVDYDGIRMVARERAGTLITMFVTRSITEPPMSGICVVSQIYN